MSKTSQKGRIGERGTRDFLRMWYPKDHPGREAVDASNSQGINDVGDISGVPYTTIECKNHSNPVLGSLLSNAQWKANNAGRHIWWLIYKRKGHSERYAGHWNACTTVRGFMEGFLPEWYDDGGISFSYDELPDLCRDEEGHLLRVTRDFPYLSPSAHPWSVFLMFRSYMRNVDRNRQDDMDFAESLGYAGHDTSKLGVPFIVHPRIDHDPEDWYVHGDLWGVARLLETVGILPERSHDYESLDAQAQELQIPSADLAYRAAQAEFEKLGIAE